jgi:tetratricopeptide (TPR) repeat protein
VAARPAAPKAPPGVAGLDLPSPVSARPAAPKAPPGVSGLDLPAPSGGQHGHAPKAPPPPPSHGGAPFDLPSPIGLDLPAPAQARSGAPQLQSDLDLPQSAGAVGDLPTPVGLDLPGAANLDLPEPKTGLEVQPADNLVAPANLDLEPAGTGLTPAEMGLESRDAGGLAPKEAGIGPAAGVDGVGARPGYAEPSGPIPRALSDGGGSRKLIYGVAAVGLLGALAGGLYMAGVFGSEPEPTGQRGVAKKKNPDKDPKDGQQAPAVEAKDRSAAVLALLDKDTPSGYADAAKAAEEEGDLIGKAEALLLLHLRYGPDMESAKAGAKAFEPYGKNEEAYAKRVGGLIAVINKQFEPAANALAGDDARLAAYRAIMHLASEKPAEAATEAKAAASLALGKALALEAQLATNPDAGYAALEAAVKATPEHPGLAKMLAEQALARGELRVAEQTLDKVATDTLPAGFRGKLSGLRGTIAAAKGDSVTAMGHFDEALAAAPKDTEILEAKVRAGIRGKLIAPATEAMGALRELQPDSVDVSLLGVELQIAGGKGDDALAALEPLAKSAPERIEVPFLRGEVQAMRLQMDDAKAEFDKVIEKDPAFHRVALAQAAMLDAARMKVEAIAALDAGVSRLREAKAPAEAIAELLTAKARYLIDQKQTTAALAALDQALDASPTYNEAQVLRGVTRMNTGDAAGGKADLMAVYERTGSYPGLVAPLGRLFAAANQLEELEALVGSSADSPTASPEVKVVAARLRLAQKRPEDAKKLLADAMAASPNNWEAQMLMAQAVLDSGDAQEALSRIEAVRTPTPRAEVAILKGKILEYNGKHPDARVEYARAVGIAPDNLEARFLHGRLLAYAGLAKQALEELEYVTSRSQAFPRAYLNIGRAQRDLGKNDDALVSLAKALELDETLLEAHYFTGRIYLERNRLGPAVTSLQTATAEASKDAAWHPDAWLFLGRAQEKSGKTKAAKASLNKFLELAPADHNSRATVKRTLEKL